MRWYLLTINCIDDKLNDFFCQFLTRWTNVEYFAKVSFRKLIILWCFTLTKNWNLSSHRIRIIKYQNYHGCKFHLRAALPFNLIFFIQILLKCNRYFYPDISQLYKDQRDPSGSGKWKRQIYQKFAIFSHHCLGGPGKIKVICIFKYLLFEWTFLSVSFNSNKIYFKIKRKKAQKI